MEGKIPGGIPGILPLIRHGNYILVKKLHPLAITALLTFLRRKRDSIAIQPSLNHVMIELLAPEQSGKGLALYRARTLVEMEGEPGVKLVGLANPVLKNAGPLLAGKKAGTVPHQA